MLVGILSLVLLSYSAPDSKYPDPYLGFSVRTFSQRYQDGVDEATGEPTYILRRQKYFQIGLPFVLKNLAKGEVQGLKLIASPEFYFNGGTFMLNAGIGLHQDIDFLNYRTFPLGWFWEVVGGLHFGYLADKKDYDRTDGEFTGRSLSVTDQTSIAAVFKFALGPRFYITEKMHFKLRVSMDWMVGRLGYYMVRTRYSNSLGSVWGVQGQIDFR